MKFVRSFFFTNQVGWFFFSPAISICFQSLVLSHCKAAPRVLYLYYILGNVAVNPPPAILYQLVYSPKNITVVFFSKTVNPLLVYYPCNSVSIGVFSEK